MSETAALLSTTKRLLKSQGMTYRDVAHALKLSEPSVKRMFASGRLTVDRLAQVGALLGYTLAELAQEAEANKQLITRLSSAQESLLVSDIKLLLTAVCALNHWSMADILMTYAMNEAECLQHLLQLDRIRLIALLPSNRIRLLVARDFDWLPDGPISQFFRTESQDDFLGSRFRETGESFAFVHGMFTEAAFTQFHSELLWLRKRFAELHEESLELPLSQRRGASVLMAMRRSWEPQTFAALRRKP